MKAWGRDISMEARALCAVSLLVAIIASLLYHERWAKPWVPNIAVGAITIGLTVTLIQALTNRAARRAESERVASVLTVTLKAINQFMWYYLQSAANSWMHSNLGTFRSDLPTDLNGWMELLVDEFPNSDDPNPRLRPGISPVMLGKALRESLDYVVARDNDVLLNQRPELLGAMNEFHDEMERMEQLANNANLNIGPSPPDVKLAEAMDRSFRAARDLAEVCGDEASPIPPELIATLNADLQERHAEALRHRPDLTRRDI